VVCPWCAPRGQRGQGGCAGGGRAAVPDGPRDVPRGAVERRLVEARAVPGRAKYGLAAGPRTSGAAAVTGRADRGVPFLLFGSPLGVLMSVADCEPRGMRAWADDGAEKCGEVLKCNGGIPCGVGIPPGGCRFPPAGPRAVFQRRRPRCQLHRGPPRSSARTLCGAVGLQAMRQAPPRSLLQGTRPPTYTISRAARRARAGHGSLP
jgi:hypothetical protein